MLELVQGIAPFIPPAFIPIIVVLAIFLYVAYKIISLFVKTKEDVLAMAKDREESKKKRDGDSETLHAECKKNAWELERLKSEFVEMKQVEKELQSSLNELNVNIAVLGEHIKVMGETFKECLKKTTGVK